MSDEKAGPPPPLLGCLYCHAEHTTSLVSGKRRFDLGRNYPLLKCSYCGAVALFDDGGGEPDKWRIFYRRVNRSDAYYYVSTRLGKAGWLSARDALRISQNGFVQRVRVQQTIAGDVDWIQPAPMIPPPPFLASDEKVYLALRAVSYQESPPPGIWFRFGSQTVLDSGKLYVTDRAIHLMGQRKTWSHPLSEVQRVTYNHQRWSADLMSGGHAFRCQGANLSDQYDPQLIAAVMCTLAEI